MPIANFPTQLQAAIQTNMLNREFETGLVSALGFRQIADRMTFPARIGQTITDTRRGLKTPVTTPINPTANTNFDNGLTPSTFSIEQYTLGLNMYGDTMDLNMVTERVGIANQFLVNAKVSGIQAGQSLDRLARNALYFGTSVSTGGYLSGNTRVITTLGAAGTAVHVDDITGFQYLISATGNVVAVSAGTPMAVVFNNGDVYQLVGSTADGSSVSTLANGVSGTLMFSTNVTVADGTAGVGVVAATAPLVVRPNGRLSTAGLVAPTGVYNSSSYAPGDTLAMTNVLQAVSVLRSNNVPPTDGGYYNCYIDPLQMAGLQRDPDFKQFYRGAYGSEAISMGKETLIEGVRFITTTEAPQQASLGAGPIHRAIVVGQGALIEGDFEGMDAMDIADLDRSLVQMVDDVCQVTRAPLDRLSQIIAQSWYWIGGFALPTDMTATTAIIPTATASYLKRGVVIESL